MKGCEQAHESSVHERRRLRRLVATLADQTAVLDVHTHLYEQAFGPLMLYGPIELIGYHYLRAETNRVLEDLSPAGLTALEPAERARLIWQKLFVERTPLSEATRGVITTLQCLGAPSLRDWELIVRHFETISPANYVDLVFRAANVATVVMTNDILERRERACWDAGRKRDQRFRAALRIDPLLLQWPATWQKVAELGTTVSEETTPATLEEIQRFLVEWARRIDALYMAVSLPPSFTVPADSTAAAILEGAVLPACRQAGLPLAMMVGVKRGVAPALADAGDGVGMADLEWVAHLCRAYPHNGFLLTVLARENQHEAVVLARKFRNLHLFGCWWFNNNPSIIEEITRERLEMLGTSFTAQHSDARILDQLVYKWRHARQIIGDALCEKYGYLIDAGWYPSDSEVARDIQMLLGGEFERFLAQCRLGWPAAE